MYKKDANFYGGGGIVGAQIPVGTGLAFAAKYNANSGLSRDGPSNECCVTMFGDGAANQGQLFEAVNMACLWNLPVIYILENNQFGMGTSKKRAAAHTEFYSRYSKLPGIKVDGMDVLAVREAMRFSAEYTKSGNGPIILEMDTYRYHGHSMSDPGLTYRSREDVANVRKLRDPIDKVKKMIVESQIASIEEIKAIDKEIKKEVDEARVFAENAPLPEESELFTDIVSPAEEYVRGVEKTNGMGTQNW